MAPGSLVRASYNGCHCKTYATAEWRNGDGYGNGAVNSKNPTKAFPETHLRREIAKTPLSGDDIREESRHGTERIRQSRGTDYGNGRTASGNGAAERPNTATATATGGHR
eukprot:gnl/TRDRNA2_/TRDRNA2_177760_c0_seq3.p1 gnl/TRDRNA2_/TRDRNA2_177760_c0~~gnl/TRDRNA2_/TRDRNA2_177760_c0_seq3.p1  ORF type:complete len:110 (-),score=11.58 gnl/TRDRNA2_/TRDRNA2_177760_c0_seq3:607-936(-)